jgi:N,N-dimethylformamidase beta subunit-like, C-terminal
MRRLALTALAAAVLAPSAHAAELSVSPRDFSPAVRKLLVKAALPQTDRVGVRLTTRSGKSLGWIVAPSRRRFLTLRWNGRIEGVRVPDGVYRIRLEREGRRIASVPLRVDSVPPAATNFVAHNRGKRWRGDNKLLTTISPNGDGLRDFARVRFTLNEAANVHFEVSRTISAPTPVYELDAKLKAGRNFFTWYPRKEVGARTYLVRVTAVDKAGNVRIYGAANPLAGRRPSAPVIRVLGVDAGFTQESYSPGQKAKLVIETDARSLTWQVYRAGPEAIPTYSDTVMNGVAFTDPVVIPWRTRWRSAAIEIDVQPWHSGLYFVRLESDDGRVGFAPFIVRPPFWGQQSRVAVVLPTNTWQAYNFRDEDGNGWGDTWYAKGAQSTVRLGRPFWRRGVPPQYRKYDLAFLRWLEWTGKHPDFLSETDLELMPDGDALARLYDLVIFSGHSEYVTRHEYDVVQRYRDLGGNLAFLSANNFFWEVRKRGRTLVRTRKWREQGRPEAALIGVQYRANDDGRIQRPFLVRSATTTPWLWDGTGLTDGAPFGQELGGYGIEIDATTPSSPPGITLLADIPDLYGPGFTAQMTYYETPAGAKVFAAGAIDVGGTATLWPLRRIFENLWKRLETP